MVYSKMTKPLFRLLASPSTGFRSKRMICQISAGHHSHQNSICLNLCGQNWRENCMVTIHHHNPYVNVQPFCTKNGYSLVKHTRTVFFHCGKTTNCFECKRFSHTILGKETCSFTSFHILFQPCNFSVLYCIDFVKGGSTDINNVTSGVIGLNVDFFF